MEHDDGGWHKLPLGTFRISGALPSSRPNQADTDSSPVMVKVTSTACIKMYTGSWFSRCKSLSCYRFRAKTLPGGEFVLTEQRPRMQSRAEVISLNQGDGVIFAVHHRPVQGTREAYRVNLHHGVSRIRSGHRHTLGIIFHDAK